MGTKGIREWPILFDTLMGSYQHADGPPVSTAISGGAEDSENKQGKIDSEIMLDKQSARVDNAIVRNNPRGN